MFCYKVKVSINKDCEKYPKYEKELRRYIKAFKLTSLGNNEYGTDDWVKGMGFISAISDKEELVKNAKEIIWYNGEDYDTTLMYEEEDSLASIKKYKYNQYAS